MTNSLERMYVTLVGACIDGLVRALFDPPECSTEPVRDTPK